MWEIIKYYFGSLKGKKWTEEDIELANGCKLLPKSNVSGIRGGAKLHKRYDLIILDDFEDEIAFFNVNFLPDERLSFFLSPFIFSSIAKIP